MNPIKYVDPSGLFSVDWDQLWSDTRDVAAGAAAGVSDFAVSQAHGALMTAAMVADYAPFFGNVVMGQGDVATRNVTIIITGSTMAESNSAAIKQIFGVQNEGLYYESRIVVNCAGMAYSVQQTIFGATKIIKGASGGVASSGFTSTGIGAAVGVPSLAGSGAFVLVGVIQTGQGINSGLAMYNIIGDNIQRRNEYYQRFAPCGDGTGSAQGSGSGVNPWGRDGVNLNNIQSPDDLPTGWTIEQTSSGRIYIRDANNTTRMRFDPTIRYPDGGSVNPHWHFFDAAGTPLDASGLPTTTGAPNSHIYFR